MKIKTKHIVCPRCGYAYAMQNIDTKMIMCTYCQYRSIENQNKYKITPYTKLIKTC